MADVRALYIVKATTPTLHGYSREFEVATGTRDGKVVFGAKRTIPDDPAGVDVLVVGAGAPRPYTVPAEGPMVAGNPLRTGDAVRLVCTHDDLPKISGSIWVVVSDGGLSPSRDLEVG